MMRRYCTTWAVFMFATGQALCQAPEGTPAPKEEKPEVPAAQQLEQAIREGKAGVVMNLIKDRSLLEQFYLGGNRPLHKAVQQNQLKVVEVLLAAGADRYRINRALKSSIDIALERKHFEILSLLYDTAEEKDKLAMHERILDRLVRFDSVRQYDLYRKTYPKDRTYVPMEMDHFFLAAASGSVAMLESFETEGRSLKEIDPATHGGILHYLAAGGHTSVIKKLGDRLGDINAVDGMGQTALSLAAVTHSIYTADLLLSMGANPDIADSQGYGPLHRAAWWGDVELARKLLAAGADATLLTKDGRTALDIAKHNRNEDVAALLPVNARTMTGEETGDFGAILSECRRAIQELKLGQLQRHLASSNPNLNETDRLGFTLLHYAALSNSVEIVQTLLDAGADVNAPDAHGGWTPLMIAVGGDQLNLTKVLLMAGADVNAQDVRGMTALHMAHVNDNGAILEALRLAKPDETLMTADGSRPEDLSGFRAKIVRAEEEAR